jgi:hypothetical protein
MGSERDTQAVFVPEKAFGFEGGTRLRVRIRHESSSASAVIGRFRLALTSAKEPLRSVKLPVAIQSIVRTPREERSPAEAARLAAYYRSIAPGLEPLRDRLARLRPLWSDLAAPATMVMKELPEPRKTYVHVRGSFLSKGKEVAPGVPSALHPFPADAPRNRLGLARWLVDPANPLVARVTVNRIWALYFGRGIVETVEDFGAQGERPVHPELLDWLATELVRQKWSLKAMHRLIATSAVYRQRASASPEVLARDPANRLLARGPRLRLEAEMVRDNALAVAGLLSPRIGGPSVFPPQPEGIWNLVYNDDKWVTSSGDDRYRRGLYTFWRRTAPYPMFSTFDAPSREAICTRRLATNTPLQSLTTLNDPVFVDAARALARRILVEGPKEPRAAAAYGFRAATARTPGAPELDRLLGLLESELARFRANERAARELALSGDVRPPDEVDVARFAAWTVVANVLLNLDETLTKG